MFMNAGDFKDDRGGGGSGAKSSGYSGRGGGGGDDLVMDDLETEDLDGPPSRAQPLDRGALGGGRHGRAETKADEKAEIGSAGTLPSSKKSRCVPGVAPALPSARPRSHTHPPPHPSAAPWSSRSSATS
jgi:hypothetical protein